MRNKTTLRGRFFQTGLLMLGLSLVVALALVAAMLFLFSAQVPEGESFVLTVVDLFLGELKGPGRMLPYLILGILLLCLSVAAVCIALTSRLTGQIGATLKTLRRAADRLREGDLDFEILSCRERELDELGQSLESVRQRLKQAAAAEAAAQEERGLLMANLSHDMRTPITAIKGYVEGIRDGIANTPEKQAHYLDIVYSKTLVLEKLVRNMTDFSEFELGRMQYHFEYVDMTDFLTDLAEEYRLEAQGAEMRFTSQLAPGRFLVTADRNKLKRVMDNLMSNAIKYGRPGGSIHLTAEPYEGGLVLQLSDNGRGISSQALAHVFDSFFRADAARSSAVPGSGLGLAICRAIMDSHHGKIWLTSEEGEGTRAFLYLPLQKEEDIL
ncbi:MAG: HAMP domain-containing sensor histidine kinase [Bacillota bacterium]|nr:HAMP domain-containing sensor histidine kinase [Bacillota bacterium]